MIKYTRAPGVEQENLMISLSTRLAEIDDTNHKPRIPLQAGIQDCSTANDWTLLFRSARTVRTVDTAEEVGKTLPIRQTVSTKKRKVE